jgi:hypothetical protein
MAYIAGNIENDECCDDDENDLLDLPTLDEMLQIVETHYSLLFMCNDNFDAEKLQEFEANKKAYILKSIQ